MNTDPARRRARHWRKTIVLTSLLLLGWFAAAFVVTYFAAALGATRFFGWPLSFYMAAQGSPILFLFLTWYYARAMDMLDQELDAAKADLQD